MRRFNMQQDLILDTGTVHFDSLAKTIFFIGDFIRSKHDDYDELQAYLTQAVTTITPQDTLIVDISNLKFIPSAGDTAIAFFLIHCGENMQTIKMKYNHESYAQSRMVKRYARICTKLELE